MLGADKFEFSAAKPKKQIPITHSQQGLDAGAARHSAAGDQQRRRLG
jgi:hypothetical protein